MLRGQVAGLGGAVQLDGFALEVGLVFGPGLWAKLGVLIADRSSLGRD